MWSARFGPEYFTLVILSSVVSAIFLSGSISSMFLDVRTLTYLLVRLLLFVLSINIVWNSNEMVLWQSTILITMIYFINTLSWISLENIEDNISKIFTFSLYAMCFVNILEFTVAPGLLSTAPGRSAGFWQNPNVSADAILLSWIMVKAASADNTGRNFYKNLIIDSVSAIGILTTASRSGIINFIISYILLNTYQIIYHKNMRKDILIRLFLVIFFIVFVYFLSTGLMEESSYSRFQSLLTGDFSDQSTFGRENALLDHLARFAAHPWTGAGAFQSIDITQGLGPHNSYVGIAADFGIFGFVLYIIPMIIALRNIEFKKNMDFISKMSSGLFMWLFMTSFFSHDIPYSINGWIALSTLLGLAHHRTLAKSGRSIQNAARHPA